MEVTDLDYELPERLIAQRPLERRAEARLLVVDQDRDAPDHARVADLPGLLRPSLVVVNDTRVRPARLLGHKASGGRAELLLVEPLGDDRWLALGRSSKPLKAGARLSFGEREAPALTATVVARRDGGQLEVQLAAADVDAAIERVGRVPLPPYIRRDPDAADVDRYQTVFADEVGAVAAPTAGLHFTPALVAALEAAGHAVARVTLHVGPGTFRPVKAARLEEHAMHHERFRVPAATAEAIADARRAGRPVVAVGTTVVRTLEASAAAHGEVRAGEGRTDLFIRPGFAFRAVDALLTNFHLPRSTLLALVMALGGVERVRLAYLEAVRAEYRFFSYGDAMLIRGPESRP